MNSTASLIRMALRELGDNARFRDLKERLAAMGVTVTPQQVSNEKRKLRGAYDLGDLPVSVIKKVKALVDEVGSVEVVRRALNELEFLRDRTESSERAGGRPGRTARD